MVCNELNSRMPLQQKIRFYVPFESTCCLFVGYWHEFPSRESYDEFVLNPNSVEMLISFFSVSENLSQKYNQ